MPLLSGPAEELEKSGMVPAVAAAPKATDFRNVRRFVIILFYPNLLNFDEF
jgi:hypothetical protein